MCGTKLKKDKCFFIYTCCIYLNDVQLSPVLNTYTDELPIVLAYSTMHINMNCFVYLFEFLLKIYIVLAEGKLISSLTSIPHFKVYILNLIYVVK